MANHQQNRNNGFNNQPSYTTTTGGKNPRQIHIAHRRSPSELTNLMSMYSKNSLFQSFGPNFFFFVYAYTNSFLVEQITLQRQLELVQAQQQQILSQQQLGHHQGASSQGNFNQGPTGQYQPPQNHRRTGSNTHRRSQSSMTGAMGAFSMPNSLAPAPKLNSPSPSGSISGGSNQSALGHNRRHSLGLNEAKKAAAQVQAQRSGKEPSIEIDEASNNSMPPPSGFKFPSTVIDAPSPNNNSLSRRPSNGAGHGRSRSSVAHSPQRSYQFPPKSPQQQPSDSLAPPPSSGGYHERRQSGHNRNNSRSFDPSSNINSNWRSQQRQASPSRQSQSSNFENLLEPPQPQFTPGHRPRGSHGGNSISSLSGFQLPGQVGGRKSLFAPYLPQSSIPDLVAEGRLVVGTLRVNKKNRSDAYVSTDGLLDADIFICGSKDRNRALEGDLVAVELLSVDEVWSGKREKEEKKRRKDHNTSDVIIDDVHNDASTHSTTEITPDHEKKSSDDSTTSNSGGSLKRKGSLKQRPTLKKNDDVEVEGQSLLLVEEEEINDEYKPLYAGHVVAVIDRIPGQLFAGTLGLLRPSQQAKEQSTPSRPKIVWFKPTDKKVPLIAIPTEQAPKDFVENHDKYSDKLFVASIKRWPITSLHPFGTLVSELGPMNDSRTEVDAILRDNNFLCEEYLDEYGNEREDFELNEVNFEEEFAKRRDFSNEYSLAISETGINSDNALHVKRTSDAKIELGVHITDVCAFIKEGSLLDKKARKRSSSVFLAQKSVNLLPKSVNDVLSFKKNEKNLSISVVFEIDTTKFEVDNVWIGESFIQPKNRLTYDQIDSILKDEHGEINISSASKDYIKTISLISREFRRQRLENNLLNNEINLTLIDQIDDEKVRLHLNLFKSSLSSSILNEIFYKVNGTIAQRTYAILGDCAFLRRQTIPTLQKLETFKRKINNLGIEIDTSSSAKLINSILSIKDEIKRQCVEILFYKCLTRSKYFVAGKVEPENYGAFYFNLPLYTHFTSPLRRYSDLIVHRQLKATFDESSNNNVVVISNEELESLKMTAEYCNFKKDCAKASQDQSIHLLLSQTINEMSKKTGQLIVNGIVLQVYESAFDVFLPEFGIEKRVHGDQLPLKKAEFDRKNGVLELYWEKGIDSGTYIPDDEREPLSYRNSIKNKFKTSANEIAKVQQKILLEQENLISSDLVEELEKLKLTPPRFDIPSSEGSISGGGSSSGGDFSDDTFTTQSLPTTPVDNPKRIFNERTSSSSKIDKISKNENGKSAIDVYLENLTLRIEGEDYIQEVKELSTIPILLRAEIGMALPCLTVHALNPFTNAE